MQKDKDCWKYVYIYIYIQILFLPVFGQKKPVILVELFPDPMVRSMNSPQHGGLISTGTASIGERVLHDVLAWKPTSWTRNWGETTAADQPPATSKYLIRWETTYISGVCETLVRPFVLRFRAICKDTMHMILEFILQTDPCYQTISWGLYPIGLFVSRNWMLINVKYHRICEIFLGKWWCLDIYWKHVH